MAKTVGVSVGVYERPRKRKLRASPRAAIVAAVVVLVAAASLEADLT